MSVTSSNNALNLLNSTSHTSTASTSPISVLVAFSSPALRLAFQCYLSHDILEVLDFWMEQSAGRDVQLMPGEGIQAEVCEQRTGGKERERSLYRYPEDVTDINLPPTPRAQAKVVKEQEVRERKEGKEVLDWRQRRGLRSINWRS